MKGMADVFGCYATSEKVRDTLFVIGKEQARCGLGIQRIIHNKEGAVDGFRR